MKRNAIILAAGKGERMRSLNPNYSKVAYPILGKAMINYVIDAVKPLELNRLVTVVGFGGDITSSLVEKESEVVWQKEILGTGHAVSMTKDLLKDEEGQTLIIFGDTPLISFTTIDKIFRRHNRFKNALTVVTAVLDKPSGYGRILREEKSNRILAIREETDCSDEELENREVNTGICVIDNKLLFSYIDRLSCNNQRKLFYLSELVEIFRKEGFLVDTFVASDMREVFGINTRNQLAYAAKVMRKRINERLMFTGVSIEDPDSTYISPDVKIGQDTVIHPNTTILGNSVIGENNMIGPNTYLEDVRIGDNNTIRSSYVECSTIKSNENIGPFMNIKDNIKV